MSVQFDALREEMTLCISDLAVVQVASVREALAKVSTATWKVPHELLHDSFRDSNEPVVVTARLADVAVAWHAPVTPAPVDRRRTPRQTLLTGRSWWT